MNISPAVTSTKPGTFYRSARVLSSELPQLPSIPWGGKGGLKASVTYDSAAVTRTFQEKVPTDHIPSEWSGGPRPSKPFQDIYNTTPDLNASGELLFEKSTKEFDIPSVSGLTLLKQHGGKAAHTFLDASKATAPILTGGGALAGLVMGLKSAESLGTSIGLGAAGGAVAALLFSGYAACASYLDDIASTPANYELKWEERKVADETYLGSTKNEWDDGFISYSTNFDRKEVGSYFEPVLVTNMRPSASDRYR